MLTANIKHEYGDEWSGDLLNAGDRWQFGMHLMGYRDAKAADMPTPTNKKN